MIHQTPPVSTAFPQPSDTISSRRLRKASLMLGLSLAAWLLAWEAARLLMVGAPLPRADAIAMLSGSGTIRERVRRAADLYKEGLAPKIILTNDNQQAGWSAAEQRNPFYYEIAEQHLRTFSARFSEYPFLVEGLSRFKSPAEQKRTLQRVAAGEVDVIYGSPALLSITIRRPQIWTQDTINIPDIAEAHDFFGSSLTAWDFGKGSQADLAIGVPFESIGRLLGAGAVQVIYGSPPGSTQDHANGLHTPGNQFWTAGSAGFTDQDDARFGLALY